MTFRESSDADAEAAWIRMRAGADEFADEGDEIGGVLKRVLRTIVTPALA